MNEPSSKLTTAPETTLGQDVVALARHRLRGRRGWVLLGIAVVGGLWIGWPSLVAAGVAPLLLGVLPCVAMCALGMCMKGGSQSCDAKSAPSDADASASSAQPDLSDGRPETDR